MQKKIGFELIPVANNCSDRTSELVTSFASGRHNIIPIALDYYTGKGGAVMKGFESSSGKWVGFVDADNSTRPKEFWKLFEQSKKFDVAIGSRAVKGASITRKQPLLRRLLGRAFRELINLLFDLGVKDTQCGAKIFSRKVVDLLLQYKIVSGFEFDVQLLWVAKKNGFKIREVGIIWQNNADSKVGFLDPLKMFFSLLLLRFGFHQKSFLYKSGCRELQ